MCYFAVAEPIVTYYQSNVPELKGFIKDEKLDYYKVINEIGDFTRILYRIKELDYENKSYYSILKQRFHQHPNYEIKKIATTNYYRFGQVLCEDLIYLNGALNLFEIPEKLEVVDVRKGMLSSNDLYFPFLFGQSLVKPIVHSKQIDSFHSFNKELSTSDVLIVFGYNMNEDDNHVNALLHSFVKSGKRLIVVGNEPEENGLKSCAIKLKSQENEIEYCAVTYGNNEQVVDMIMKHLDNTI